MVHYIVICHTRSKKTKQLKLIRTAEHSARALRCAVARVFHSNSKSLRTRSTRSNETLHATVYRVCSPQPPTISDEGAILCQSKCSRPGVVDLRNGYHRVARLL